MSFSRVSYSSSQAGSDLHLWVDNRMTTAKFITLPNIIVYLTSLHVTVNRHPSLLLYCIWPKVRDVAGVLSFYLSCRLKPPIIGSGQYSTEHVNSVGHEAHSYFVGHESLKAGLVKQEISQTYSPPASRPFASTTFLSLPFHLYNKVDGMY